MKPEFAAVESRINGYEDEMVETISKMVPIKAISPKSGGTGELRRAEFLGSVLKSWGIEARRHDYRDDTGTLRPNILAGLGNNEKTIWFVGHMDTVSEGDISLWKGDPFSVRVEGERIYGRGTEDDGQGIISSMYAMKALKESGARLKYNFGLALVSDEELGSRFGMEALVNDGLFGKGDMFVVPDHGVEDGSMIEVGEKGLLWLKITVHGVQVHASTPEKGLNAFRYGMKFLNTVDMSLHTKYIKRNGLFHPDISTFEMTKHEKNVDSINIVPGTEVFYMDCRILPEYNANDVLEDIRHISSSAEFSQVRIDVDIINRTDPAPITKPDSDIISLLGSAIKDLRGITAVTAGIGGGTCAAFSRKAGMQSAVWATFTDVAHQPNEYANISDMVNDAKVFAYMLL